MGLYSATDTDMAADLRDGSREWTRTSKSFGCVARTPGNAHRSPTGHQPVPETSHTSKVRMGPGAGSP